MKISNLYTLGALALCLTLVGVSSAKQGGQGPTIEAFTQMTKEEAHQLTSEELSALIKATPASELIKTNLAIKLSSDQLANLSKEERLKIRGMENEILSQEERNVRRERALQARIASVLDTTRDSSSDWEEWETPREEGLSVMAREKDPRYMSTFIRLLGESRFPYLRRGAVKAISNLPAPINEAIEPFLLAQGTLGIKLLNPDKREEAVHHLADTFDVNPAVARIRVDDVFPAPAEGQLTL